ncbi:MAG: filamentous hemagglutinin N-terminal domain-containing protein [Thermodesulfobacteriota bacterium]|nr:filamentous hemagglutinin N-terminal domain-containing protein [Thermodesulfobacteriota bacterium]
MSTDGTVGPARSLSGPDYQITEELGTAVGQNLFHSFYDFSIAFGESATFTGPDSILNVISRVTGGEVSSINGLLRSQIGHADFYFINPAGVMFGPGAQVDVPGAFHVTTADELQFADGNIFSSSNPDTSTLTMAEPASFGFLSARPASIILNGAQLNFTPESTITLAGGEVGITLMGKAEAQGGSIRLVGVGEGPNEINIDDVSTATAPLGDVSIDLFSGIDVSGVTGSGSVTVQGGEIQVVDSDIAADNYGAEDSSGKIFIQGEDVQIINSDVHAQVFSEGRGSDIVVQAGDVKIDAATASDGRSRIATRVRDAAQGDAGDISISAERVSLENGGQVSSVIEESALGDGGKIHIGASDDFLIHGNNQSGIYSLIGTTTLSTMGGCGGDIVIDAPDAAVTMSEGGTVQAGTAGPGDSGNIFFNVKGVTIVNEAEISTFTKAESKGGDITITAGDSINLNNGKIDLSSYGAGCGGKLFMSGRKLTLENGSEVMSDAWDEGDAGMIQVDIDGEATLDSVSAIETATNGSGSAGFLELEVGSLNLLDGSSLYAGSSGIGTGGRVTIDVNERFFIDNNSFVSSGIWDSGKGRAGYIQIKARDIDLFNGGLMDNSTWGDQDAGTISVETENLRIQGKGIMTGINSNAEAGAGNGGDVEILVKNSLELLNGGQISSNTRDKGDAGKVSVETDSLYINGGGYDQSQFTGIFSDTRLAQGNGGDVEVMIHGQGKIHDGGAISSSADNSDGDAGRVTVTAAGLLINGQNQIIQTGVLSRSLGPLGNGGDVEVSIMGRLDLLNGGQISSSVSSGAGNGGSLMVEASEVFIEGKADSWFDEEYNPSLPVVNIVNKNSRLKIVPICSNI